MMPNATAELNDNDEDDDEEAVRIDHKRTLRKIGKDEPPTKTKKKPRVLVEVRHLLLFVLSSLQDCNLLLFFHYQVIS